MLRVLLVEDDPFLSESLKRWLGRSADIEVDHAADLAEANAQLFAHEYVLVICDDQLPDGRGEQWLPDVKQQRPHVVCLLQSGAYSELEAAGLQAQTGLDGVHAKGAQTLGAIDGYLARIRDPSTRPVIDDPTPPVETIPAPIAPAWDPHQAPDDLPE